MKTPRILLFLLMFTTGYTLQAQENYSLRQLRESLNELGKGLTGKELEAAEKEAYSRLFGHAMEFKIEPSDSLPFVSISTNGKDPLRIYTCISGQRYMSVMQYPMPDSTFMVIGSSRDAWYTHIFRLPDTSRELYLLTGHRYNEAGEFVYCANTMGPAKKTLNPNTTTFEKNASVLEYAMGSKEKCDDCMIYNENTATLEIKNITGNRSLYARYRPAKPLKIDTGSKTSLVYRFSGKRFTRE